ncbi:MAG: hypothetical protein ABIH72_05985 [archaeon]
MKKGLRILTILIIVFLVISIAVYIVYLIKINQDIKKYNISTLKIVKCFSNCPFEYNQTLNKTWMTSECVNFCIEKYQIEYPRISAQKYFEKMVITEFAQCFNKEYNEEEFKSCLNQGLDAYTYIIDLSEENTTPS